MPFIFTNRVSVRKYFEQHTDGRASLRGHDDESTTVDNFEAARDFFNKHEEVPHTITLNTSSEVYESLEGFLKTGLFGWTVEDVAEELLRRSVREMAQRGF